MASTPTARRPVSVVTGAAGGIGRAVVDSLRAEGRTVIGVDRVPGPHTGDRVCDVTDPAAVEQLVGTIEAEDGPIDQLVNGAGVLSNLPALETTPQEWQRVIHANTTSVFAMSTSVARRMVSRCDGVIVTVASNSGRLPRHGMAAYGASKAAAALFTQSLGLELAEHGIRCNVVSPGTTRTPMVDGMLRDSGADEASVIVGNPATFKAGIPLRRLADPRDIASAVVFLLSDMARHITMQDIVVDGGATQNR